MQFPGHFVLAEGGKKEGERGVGVVTGIPWTTDTHCQTLHAHPRTRIAFLSINSNHFVQIIACEASGQSLHNTSHSILV